MKPRLVVVGDLLLDRVEGAAEQVDEHLLRFLYGCGGRRLDRQGLVGQGFQRVRLARSSPRRTPRARAASAAIRTFWLVPLS